jgi:hypothetical protein
MVKPKKEISARSLYVSTESDLAMRDAFRFLLFMLAERLFPARFNELRRRVLPIYERLRPARRGGKVSSGATGQTVIRRGHATWSVPTEVELHQRIGRWVRRLGVVKNSDYWLRELTLQRVRAWQEGCDRMPIPLIGGIPPLVIAGLRPDEDSRGFRQRARKEIDDYLRREAPRWRMKRKFLHHFEWFLQNRMGGKKPSQLAREWDKRKGLKEWDEPTHVGVVQRGIQSVADLVDPPAEL